MNPPAGRPSRDIGWTICDDSVGNLFWPRKIGRSGGERQRLQTPQNVENFGGWSGQQCSVGVKPGEFFLFLTTHSVGFFQTSTYEKPRRLVPPSSYRDIKSLCIEVARGMGTPARREMDG